MTFLSGFFSLKHCFGELKGEPLLPYSLFLLGFLHKKAHL